MQHNFNFEIKPAGSISAAFLERNIPDFNSAMQFTRQLPYGRNNNKYNLLTVFDDNCGTCSTKHALLKTLAVENDQPNVKLVLGLFKMNKFNTPKVISLLIKNNLDHIPEAHNYLKIDDEIIDCTNLNSGPGDFVNDLISEQEIQPAQITGFKVALHKAYLQEWLPKQPGLAISFSELWQIREECIAALSTS